MRNILLTIEYEGTNYHGWQRQKNAITIQQLIELAIERVTGEKPALIGSGRTDSGVHALGQRANFKTKTAIDVSRIPLALNSNLPPDIRVIHAQEMPFGFHARYDVFGKKYRYRIYNSDIRSAIHRNFCCYIPERLELDRMIEASRYMVGKRDFSSFCSSGSLVRSKIRAIELLELTADGKMIDIVVRADGFLYNMVRIIAGTLVEVGRGSMDPRQVKVILDKKDRRYAGPTLPPQGLFLEEVYYKRDS